MFAEIALAAFVLLAALLPFAAVPLPGLGAVGLAQIALLALHTSWLPRARFRLLAVAPQPLGGVVLVFLGLAILAFIGGALAFGPAEAANRAIANLVLSVLLFFGTIRVVRTSAALERVLRLFLLAATLAAAAALVLYALPRSAAESILRALVPLGYPAGPEITRVIWGTEIARATGAAVDPNLLGGLLVVGAALLAGQTLAARPVLPRRTLFLCGGVVLLALALTFSRGAWVGLAAAVVYLAACVDRRVWVAVALGGLAVLAVPQARDRIAAAATVQDEASLMRMAEYRASLELIAQHPLGVGFGPAPGVTLVRPVSNMYLLVAEQMGVAGLAAFLAAIGLILRATLRGAGSRAAHVAGLPAAAVGMLTTGLFDHYFMNSLFPHTPGLFWLTLGLLVAGTRLSVAPASGAAPQPADPGRR